MLLDSQSLLDKRQWISHLLSLDIKSETCLPRPTYGSCGVLHGSGQRQRKIRNLIMDRKESVCFILFAFVITSYKPNNSIHSFIVEFT